jgi:hypothetical protein
VIAVSLGVPAMLQVAVPPSKQATKSHRFENETFREQTIAIDGNQYINCTFIQCRIIFSGYEVGVFDGCTFVRCAWGFAGSAANTLNYLAAIYNGLGKNSQEMIEGIFESIRRDLVKTGELLPLPSASK